MITAQKHIKHTIDLINEGEMSQFIEFAKSFNIFQNSTHKGYNAICDLIKARLDREGLSYDIVRPEQ